MYQYEHVHVPLRLFIILPCPSYSGKIWWGLNLKFGGTGIARCLHSHGFHSKSLIFLINPPAPNFLLYGMLCGALCAWFFTYIIHTHIHTEVPLERSCMAGYSFCWGLPMMLDLPPVSDHWFPHRVDAYRICQNTYYAHICRHQSAVSLNDDIY